MAPSDYVWQNHSEIEKRRRDKMNTFITELSDMVPMCSAMSRKLDKLTVLRMAVQHMKTLRGPRIHSYTEGHYKPSFITDHELKKLILQSAEGFLFVVGCDRGRLLYVSESVYQVLKYSQTDLLGQSWFDILHPKDVAKVKEQLSSSDMAPRERLIDAKTMLPVKGNVPQESNRLCPGARRSFFCRMKCKLSQQVKEENESMNSCHRKKMSGTSERKYTVVHCTGYLKSWAKVGMYEAEGEAEDACNLSCLVAVGRVLPSISSSSMGSKSRSVTFVSRHTADGKFVFVDQRATLMLGFLPQELLGTSMYEYYHSDDISGLAEAHKMALRCSDSVTTPVYQFRTRSSRYVKLVSTWKAFRNPWTKETEYLLAKHLYMPCEQTDICGPRTKPVASSEFEIFSNNGGTSNENKYIQRLISTQMEASKIGKLIADEIADPNRRLGDTSSSSSPGEVDRPIGKVSTGDSHKQSTLATGETLPNSFPPHCQESLEREASTSHNLHVEDTPLKPSSPNSVKTVPSEQGDPTQASTRLGGVEMGGGYIIVGGEEMLGENLNQTNSSDGNDEAAMAVIMSLLEADAGLGGPVDFSGLPWPLP
ncbi:unnamed protein product [Allacma fusca]|uniref:Aryl hydrocarbon receptor nuclear translocator-like protein 1 n=1 Tax=Allacma fusca TaxID=39272 RepID=A0A8J2LE17_9HEXA|nr:unnamed protein product [Allacma fusca]